MVAAYADGSFTTKVRTYSGPSMLVIDDVGITPLTEPKPTPSSKSSTAATKTAPPPS
jgi:hypothetical protein